MFNHFLNLLMLCILICSSIHWSVFLYVAELHLLWCKFLLNWVYINMFSVNSLPSDSQSRLLPPDRLILSKFNQPQKKKVLNYFTISSSVRCLLLLCIVIYRCPYVSILMSSQPHFPKYAKYSHEQCWIFNDHFLVYFYDCG